MEWLNQLVCIGDVPSGNKGRVVIVPDGTVEASGFEDFEVNEKTTAPLLAEFKDRGNDIPIDFEHASLFKGARGEAAPAIGWIKELRYEKGVGLVATVEWSKQASEHIAKEEYKYLSPVLDFDKDRNLSRITSVALTNQPRIKNMRELLAASEAARAYEKEFNMPRKKRECSLTLTGSREKLRKTFSRLIAAEVLPDVEIATEELPEEQVEALDEVGTAIEELKAALGDEAAEMSAVEVIKMAASKLGDGDESEEAVKEEAASLVASLAAKLGLGKNAGAKDVVEKIDTMKITKVDAEAFSLVKKELDELKAIEAKRNADMLVGKAVEAGKLNPHDDEQMSWARDIALGDAEAFSRILDKAPALYATGRLTPIDPDGPRNKRDKLIASNAAEFDANRDMILCDSRDGYVDAALTTEGMSGLTDGERKKLVNA